MRDRMTSPDSVLLCVAADRDLPALRAVLADLPADQYGQVYVESSSAGVHAIPAPEGMAVSWLLRRDDDEVGARAAVAVRTWSTEWMHDAGHDALMPRLVWIGRSVRAVAGGALPHCGCGGEHPESHDAVLRGDADDAV